MACFQKIDALIDNPKSWIWQYESDIAQLLKGFADTVEIVTTAKDISSGDILFLLSCDRIIPEDVLRKHKNNIVIHESDVPRGKGWSPLSWQVEAGVNEVPVTLFEAALELDSGPWYIKDKIMLDGDELIEEIRRKQAHKTLALMKSYLSNYPMTPHPQTGEETVFPKRTARNQEIDAGSSLESQFNKLRVCDNERYPAFFHHKGQKYILKIYREQG